MNSLTKQVVTLLLIFAFTPIFSQGYWQKKKTDEVTQTRRSNDKLPSKYQVFELKTDLFKNVVKKSPMRGINSSVNGTEVSFPMADGSLKSFRIFEAPVMDAKLSARFPEIKSYAGQGIDDPSESVRFSISHKGIKSMLFSHNGYEFIEPYTEDGTHYIVYKRKDRHRAESNFECTLEDHVTSKVKDDATIRNNADDGTLRTFRLAVSTNGEYTNYHGGTVADALAAMNTTMTRVNGIFEVDFNVTLVLINSTTDVIYTNASTDPYSNNSGQWNGQLQNTLTSQIGEGNYDVGHLFAQGGNNGNAGCIGCVCVNNQKGSGWTSRGIPEGDPFDVDYVAHELGHQFGGNHTWTHGGNEGTNVQMEPGSGSTIMGYAGITGNTDVQQNSDPYFHAASIEQITDYIKTTSCQTNTNTGNSVPSVNAGSNYTIPRGTPFTLSGTGSDADGDALTYCWEQMDENNASTTFPSPTATSGVAFRSVNPKTVGDRTFPAMETVLTGSTSSQWEVVPTVGRTLNFRLTVRDNVAGGGTNESDNMVVTVNGSTGPFVLNSPNTNVNWTAGSSQNVTWDVAGTNGSPVNASNVNILLSTDGGTTFTITLAANVANDGSHTVTVPNNQGTQNRIKVEAANNIFFDVSDANFTISGQVPCTATIPTGLNASNVGSNTATLSWNAVAGAASYGVRYRASGTASWTNTSAAGISADLTGLSPLTTYEAQVRSTCPDGDNSGYSSSVTFTTTEVQLNYCSSNGNNATEEYIGNVTIADINNTSGSAAGGYADFTSIVGNISTGETVNVSITPVWTGTVYPEGYAIWIDYNGDGDFTDPDEQVLTQAATTTTPVIGSFTVPAGAALGNTRMRVSLKYNDTPDPCESFTYGEVEDYTVTISETGCAVGSSCDDGDACTTGDVFDADCNCAGTLADADGDGVCDADDQCPGGDDNQDSDNDGTPDFCDDCDNNLEGTSCDDGNDCTIGDAFDANCNCVGTLQDADGDGVCDADDICPGGDDNQDEDGDGTPDFCDDCNNNLAGTSCDDGDACTTGDVFDANCNCAGTFADADSDGVCDADDICAGGDDNQDEDGDGTPDFCDDCNNNLAGTSCDDGDACTTGDVFDANCNCAGTFADADGDGVCDADDLCPNSAAGSAVNGDGCILGCTDANAYNYNANAQVDDGSCATCNDGLQNGDETGIDCGGSCEPCNTGGCNDVTFTLLTDNYPGETTWSLTDASGTTVASGGPYNTQNTTFSEDFCLVDGCYTFTINDSYGDGICCGFGNGNYTLTAADGSVIKSGGNFNSVETTDFCVPYENTSGDCLEIDFNNYTVNSYGGNQDQGTASIIQSGAGVSIFNNAWKAISQDYDVTGSTVLEFEFRSTTQGEIHGIGFDNNNGISSGFTFRVYGTQNWGNGDFDYNGSGNWQSFTIPVGQYYTGSFDRIFFVCDKDAGSSTSNSYFRNIQVHEGAGCGAALNGDIAISTRDEKTPMVHGLPDAGADLAINLYPNPARDILYLNVDMEQNVTTTVQVVNTLGQVVIDQNITLSRGDNTISLQTDNLATGQYFVKMNVDGNNFIEKVSIVK